MIRKISGKHQSTPIKHLFKNHIEATSKKNVADLLAKSFSKNSSSNNYNRQFQNTKKNAEKRKLYFKSTNLEDYNKPFTLTEPKNSLQDLIIQLSDQMKSTTNF